MSACTNGIPAWPILVLYSMFTIVFWCFVAECARGVNSWPVRIACGTTCIGVPTFLFGMLTVFCT